ncbi:hypothetical protein C7459_1612 [Tumebacillus permanentifrigoris]|uniref:Uncharacterized protein n=1 Tax=Tumebacillus permanentifrigoris TaxID=378543 RepID=A0A316D267_9BACL|nr:hypothetical protein C7459_1612 [Tumebacillus permanentifrigoris]
MLKKVSSVKATVSIPIDVCSLSCFLGDCTVSCGISVGH